MKLWNHNFVYNNYKNNMISTHSNVTLIISIIFKNKNTIIIFVLLIIILTILTLPILLTLNLKNNIDNVKMISKMVVIIVNNVNIFNIRNMVKSFYCNHNIKNINIINNNNNHFSKLRNSQISCDTNKMFDVKFNSNIDIITYIDNITHIL